MKKLVFGLLVFLGLAAIFAVTPTSAYASTINPEIVSVLSGDVLSSNTEPTTPNEVVKDPSNGGSSVVNPTTLGQYGPIGGLISVILGGVVLIYKAVNEGRKIDVDRYKDLAREAQERSENEIGKMQVKLSNAETQFDAMSAMKDRERAVFEGKKAAFNEQLIANEGKHRKEIELLHNKLVIEISRRYDMETLLAQHGIDIPEINDSVSIKAVKEATEILDTA